MILKKIGFTLEEALSGSFLEIILCVCVCVCVPFWLCFPGDPELMCPFTGLMALRSPATPCASCFLLLLLLLSRISRVCLCATP